MATTKYLVQIVDRIHWDGSDETAGEFGYGDYHRTEYTDVGTIEAPTIRKAYAAAKRLIKDKLGYTGIRFSGVGFNATLREVR